MNLPQPIGDLVGELVADGSMGTGRAHDES